VEVTEEPTHPQRRGQVAVHVQPALQVRHGDAELIQAGQRLGAPAVADGDGERGVAVAEGVRRPARRRHREWDGRLGGEECLIAPLQGGHYLAEADVWC
jgi:hypothetical protein